MLARPETEKRVQPLRVSQALEGGGGLSGSGAYGTCGTFRARGDPLLGSIATPRVREPSARANTSSNTAPSSGPVFIF
jgi:hypothetical protein